LIDFDFAGVESTQYIKGFNRVGIPERHPQAAAGMPMQKEHDWYALAQILQQYDCTDTEWHKTMVAALLTGDIDKALSLPSPSTISLRYRASVPMEVSH